MKTISNTKGDNIMTVDVKDVVKLGSILTIETYAVLKMAGMVNKERKKVKELKKEIKKYETALDLYEIANEALSREIDELENEKKGRESV